MRDILTDPFFAAEAPEAATDFARRAYARLWRSGIACFSRVPVARMTGTGSRPLNEMWLRGD